MIDGMLPLNQDSLRGLVGKRLTMHHTPNTLTFVTDYRVCGDGTSLVKCFDGWKTAAWLFQYARHEDGRLIGEPPKVSHADFSPIDPDVQAEIDRVLK